MEGPYAEQFTQTCNKLRGSIEALKGPIVELHGHPVFELPDVELDGFNQPPNMNGNMHANLTLAFRHLEDARMRIGKVLQALQGGVSVFDRKEGGS